ncbi:DUF1731 domain-containing protein [Priestia megaterium]|nr:DUF1731 domain-containing protein [Priestia megaterium]
MKNLWVIPERLEREEFKFKFDKIEKALQQILEN